MYVNSLLIEYPRLNRPCAEWSEYQPPESKISSIDNSMDCLFCTRGAFIIQYSVHAVDHIITWLTLSAWYTHFLKAHGKNCPWFLDAMKLIYAWQTPHFFWGDKQSLDNRLPQTLCTSKNKVIFKIWNPSIKFADLGARSKQAFLWVRHWGIFWAQKWRHFKSLKF